jgi:hypothetical protein
LSLETNLCVWVNETFSSHIISKAINMVNSHNFNCKKNRNSAKYGFTSFLTFHLNHTTSSHCRLWRSTSLTPHVCVHAHTHTQNIRSYILAGFLLFSFILKMVTANYTEMSAHLETYMWMNPESRSQTFARHDSRHTDSYQWNRECIQHVDDNKPGDTCMILTLQI